MTMPALLSIRADLDRDFLRTRQGGGAGRMAGIEKNIGLPATKHCHHAWQSEMEIVKTNGENGRKWTKMDVNGRKW